MPDNKKQENNEVKPFSNLDLNKWYCFGIQHPKDMSWVNLCIKSQNLGWNKINVKSLEMSLSQNVNSSYLHIASFYLTDLDDDIKYLCFFDNQKCMWGLQIQDSPKAEIDIDQKTDFFKSDMFINLASRTADIVTRALNEYNNVIEQRLKNGELLEVDEVKLSAILYLINQQITIDNIRNGKWMK